METARSGARREAVAARRRCRPRAEGPGGAGFLRRRDEPRAPARDPAGTGGRTHRARAARARPRGAGSRRCCGSSRSPIAAFGAGPWAGGAVHQRQCGAGDRGASPFRANSPACRPMRWARARKAAAMAAGFAPVRSAEGDVDDLVRLIVAEPPVPVRRCSIPPGRSAPAISRARCGRTACKPKPPSSTAPSWWKRCRRRCAARLAQGEIDGVLHLFGTDGGGLPGRCGCRWN